MGETFPIDFLVKKGSPTQDASRHMGLGWLGFHILKMVHNPGGDEHASWVGGRSNLSNKMVASAPVLAKPRVTYGDDVWVMNVPIFAQIKCSFRLINMPSSR